MGVHENAAKLTILLLEYSIITFRANMKNKEVKYQVAFFYVVIN